MWQRDFSELIKWRIFEIGHCLERFRRAQCNHKGLHKWKREAGSQRRGCDDEAGVGVMWLLTLQTGKGHGKGPGLWWLVGAGKGKETDSPTETFGGAQPLWHLDLVLRHLLQTTYLQTIRHYIVFAPPNTPTSCFLFALGSILAPHVCLVSAVPISPTLAVLQGQVPPFLPQTAPTALPPQLPKSSADAGMVCSDPWTPSVFWRVLLIMCNPWPL